MKVKDRICNFYIVFNVPIIILIKSIPKIEQIFGEGVDAKNDLPNMRFSECQRKRKWGILHKLNTNILHKGHRSSCSKDIRSS